MEIYAPCAKAIQSDLFGLTERESNTLHSFERPKRERKGDSERARERDRNGGRGRKVGRLPGSLANATPKRLIKLKVEQPNK